MNRLFGGISLTKLNKYLMPLGMIGVIFYFIHIIVGQILWSSYNPITTDISTLTANGSPNAGLLSIFTTIYGICMILFVIALFKKALICKKVKF